MYFLAILGGALVLVQVLPPTGFVLGLYGVIAFIIRLQIGRHQRARLAAETNRLVAIHRQRFGDGSVRSFLAGFGDGFGDGYADASADGGDVLGVLFGLGLKAGAGWLADKAISPEERASARQIRANRTRLAQIGGHIWFCGAGVLVGMIGLSHFASTGDIPSVLTRQNQNSEPASAEVSPSMPPRDDGGSPDVAVQKPDAVPMEKPVTSSPAPAVTTVPAERRAASKTRKDGKRREAGTSNKRATVTDPAAHRPQSRPDRPTQETSRPSSGQLDTNPW